MIKKFFVTVIVGLLVMSSQIFSAAYVDWSRAPRISSIPDFVSYINRERRNGETSFNVVLTNGIKISQEDFLYLVPSVIVFPPKIYSNNGLNMFVTYSIKEGPSARVLRAYRTNNTNSLTADEIQLYNEAVNIVNEAKKRNGYYNQELYIYTEIMRRAQYHDETDKSNIPSFLTAKGAIVDGQANCQGYSDAFYLLGNMMGWNVGKMGGDNHVWNTIEFGDGKVYCVDVTWGDEALKYNGRERKLNSYIYFNAPAEIMSATHEWNRDLEPANLQPSVDKRYSYYETSSHLRHLSNAETGLKLIAKKIATEKLKWFSVMVPYDERYNNAHKKQVMDYLEREFAALRLPVGTNFWTNIKEVGNYLFITVDVFNP